MKLSKRTLRVGSLSLVLVVAAAVGADDVPTLRRQAALAYQAKDWKGFLDNAEKASALRPDHPGLLYNVACARSLNGDAAGAIQALDRLAGWQVDLGASQDSDLELARQSPDYARVAKRWELTHQPVGAATVAFDLPGADLREGIALDPKSGSVFVGSVHERGILRRTAKGEVTPFTSEPTLGVFGMGIDAKRKLLWAATSALPEMKGYTKDHEGATELVAFDLATGKVTARRKPADDGQRHSLNDVAVTRKGEVFVSDSIGGVLYRLAAEGEALEVLVPKGTFGSPQGLALSGDGKRLYVADYATTVYRIDLPVKAGIAVVPERLTVPASMTTLGIDGLVWHDGTLVAIQNGITPHRVVALRLNDRGSAIDSASILLMNDPRFDEPTLGVVSSGSLLLVANSHWGRFDPRAPAPDASSIAPTTILRLRL